MTETCRTVTICNPKKFPATSSSQHIHDSQNGPVLPGLVSCSSLVAQQDALEKGHLGTSWGHFSSNQYGFHMVPSQLPRSCRLSTPISTAPTRSPSTGTSAPSPARRLRRCKSRWHRSRWRRRRRRGRANPGARVDRNFDSSPL